MAGSEHDKPDVKPSEQAGGTKPDAAEVADKGPWTEQAREGVVPAELGGSDAPPELTGDEGEMRDDVLGRTTGGDEPATEEGIDPTGGDRADAVTDGGPEPPEGAEPDLKDVAAAAREREKG